MKIAILGATSEIAKDLIAEFLNNSNHQLSLFARNQRAIASWLETLKKTNRCSIKSFDQFGSNDHFDVIINFVGVGNPLKLDSIGSSILDITYYFDNLVISYLKVNPSTRYIFLSSGAVYGTSFSKPVDENSVAKIRLNELTSQNWYGIAKLYAECRHRSLNDYSIVDLRIFNYFSHTQDMNARFLIADIVRAIRDKSCLVTSSDNIIRDFLIPDDFSQLVSKIVISPPKNIAVDCFTLSPIDKLTLLLRMKELFGLRYEIKDSHVDIQPTGLKLSYFSTSKKAMEFGYVPHYTSLSGIEKEIKMLLN